MTALVLIGVAGWIAARFTLLAFLAAAREHRERMERIEQARKHREHPARIARREFASSVLDTIDALPGTDE